MPNRSYVHPSYQMNFYWKLSMDCFATTFIFDEMWGFPPKEGLSGNSFPSWPEVEIVHLAHRVTHPLPLWGHEHSRVSLSGDQATPWAWSFFTKPMLILDISVVFCAKLLRVLRSSERWLYLVFLIIIFMQGSLLYLCTNLAVWTTINQ